VIAYLSGASHFDVEIEIDYSISNLLLGRGRTKAILGKEHVEGGQILLGLLASHQRAKAVRG
jgi:hypothetical protein